jgi:hypothetical protein
LDDVCVDGAITGSEEGHEFSFDIGERARGTVDADGAEQVNSDRCVDRE